MNSYFVLPFLGVWGVTVACTGSILLKFYTNYLRHQGIVDLSLIGVRQVLLPYLARPRNSSLILAGVFSFTAARQDR